MLFYLVPLIDHLIINDVPVQCNAQVVLNTFEAQPLSDEEGNANNLEDEAATFSIKYLTSSKLMGLEVRSSML